MNLELMTRRGGLTIQGYGGKSGSSSGGVSEEADSLASISYARILLLLGEGEIYGPANQANPLQSVYLNGTPLQNADGTLNFERVTVDFRAGTQDQDIIGGFPASEAEVSVGVELTSTVAWTQAFTDLDISACRITLAVSGLSKTNAKSGKISGYEIAYVFDLQTDNGAWNTVVSTSFSGKATSTYQRSHRIDFPSATSGWKLRVRRLTANANSSLIADRTQIVSYARIIDAKLRYPMSALLGLKVDAKQFSSLPALGLDGKGRLIKVPANYDPDTRAYNGAWDGTFKVSWSDNPAWVLYDLCTLDRYGLAERIGPARLSTLKWSLYQVGQYCDELVPDGLGGGGTEPRFTCNIYKQDQSDAWKVVSDIASIFRGMAYEAAGGLLVSADMPSDPIYTYSNANVIDGKFTRVGTARSTRYSVALVGWKDLTDMGRSKVEVVENQEALSRYGLRQTEIEAFGCTSRGQAIRAGRWALLTSWACTQTITFDTGLEHALVQPGSIVRVVDQHLAGRRVGGRIVAATATSVTVDAEVVAREGDRLVVNLPDGTAESRVIGGIGFALTADTANISADSDLTVDTVGLPVKLTVITVTVPFSAVPAVAAIWTVESEQLTSQLYRIHSIARSDKNTATITGLQHEPSVLTAVDYETKIDPRSITVIPAYQGAPAGVTVSEWTVIAQGISTANITIAWTPASGATEHEVQWKRDDSSWVSAGRTGTAEMDITNVYSGTYVARVRSYNPTGVASPWAYSTATDVTGLAGDPPVVASLTASGIIFGITVNWALPAVANIIEKTEIWYGPSSDRANATKLSELSYPTNTLTLNGLAAGATLYFWARLVDKNGQVGAYYPDGAGVAGTSSTDATAILAYLKGQITKTMLYAELAKEIGLITADAAVPGSVAAQVASEARQRAALGESLANRIDTVSASQAQTAAAVQTETQARATADSALAQQITSVQAVANDAAGLVQTEAQARASADGVLAQQITTIQAVANDASAAVQTNAQAINNTDGKLAAMYTIKTQITTGGRTYVAGIGVGVENNGGVTESQVLVAADRFAVLNGTGTEGVSAPFVVQGGQTFINQAFIGDAWIKNAMIESLSGNKITAKSITADQLTIGGVTTDRIAANAVSVLTWQSVRYGDSSGHTPQGTTIGVNNVIFTPTTSIVRIDVSLSRCHRFA